MTAKHSDINSRTLAAVLYLLGKLQRALRKISSRSNGQERTRLRKQPQSRDPHEIRYPKEKIMIDMMQSYEKLLHPEIPDDMVSHNKRELGLLPEREIRPLRLTRRTPQSSGNTSDRHDVKSIDEMKVHQESQICRRTMAKTPVHYIGQLEQASFRMNDAEFLAEQYQNILPLRISTPVAPRRLRKVKCQVSLKDLVKDQARITTPSSPRSECDTLIGSESPSPSHVDDRKDQLFSTEEVSNSAPHQNRDSGVSITGMSTDDTDYKASTDFLINEISTSLLDYDQSDFLHHASREEIMLMIEAYQSIQEELHQQLQESHEVAGSGKRVGDTKEVLENWLDVLYATYDGFEERRDGGYVGEVCTSRSPARFGRYSDVETIMK